MKTFLKHAFEKFQASSWTTPVIYLVLVVALARYTLWLDSQGIRSWLVQSPYFQISSADSARALLGTIGTSMLSLAGISFSSIMVSVTLASQQFGPRLLRNFLKDQTSQRTLAILLATFVYCLYIQREIKDIDGSLHVPQFSLLISLVLAIVCLGFFIAFVQRILTEIQAEHVVENAYVQLKESLEVVFPQDEEEQIDTVPESEIERGWEIGSNKLGYVQAVNVDKLVELAEEYDLKVITTIRAGHFVTPARPVLEVLQGCSKDDAKPEMIESLQDSIYVGPVRTPEQDYEYGFRQLVEVACRALSPGINDPFTAMDCLEYLGAGLQLAFSRPLPGSVHRGADGEVRLITWKSDHGRLV